MVRATFIMEQHLGHQTYYQNLKRFVDPEPEIAATWAPITYQRDRSRERLAFLSAHLRGTLVGRRQVRRALAHPADVVFFNTQVPAVLGGRLTRRRPYVIATDITPIQYDQMGGFYGHRPDRPGPLRFYKHRRNVATLRRANWLLPWSTWVRDSLIRDYGADPQRVEVLPPGIDLERWQPAHHRPEGPLRILFVGGDMERKGGDLLFQAFRALPPGSAELLLITRSQVEPQAGVQSYYGLQPNSPELIDIYRAADIFVLPTYAEAFGVAAIEAAAVGLPAIVTAVGGLTDTVVEGETGFLIQPGDLARLTARLRLLADQPELRTRLGRAARRRAELCYDTRRNVRRLRDRMLMAAGVVEEVANGATVA